VHVDESEDLVFILGLEIWLEVAEELLHRADDRVQAWMW